MVNFKKMFMIQQSCLEPTFYQMDSMKRKLYLTKTRLDVQFVKSIHLEMIIGQQMKEEGNDQNY